MSPRRPVVDEKPHTSATAVARTPHETNDLMRFARVITTDNRHNTTIDRLIETAALDVVQLDYGAPTGSGTYATALLKQLPTLHKAMYLDPSLHVVTNAGGGNVVACIEAVAEFLCEHGSANMPLTAIRGDNVLPRIEQLLPAKQLPISLKAAHVEIGAGPIATALREGSRLVVVGCYDLAAPAIATAVAGASWNWEEPEALARLAVAAYFPETVLEIGSQHTFEFDAPTGGNFHEARIAEVFAQHADEIGKLRHADVQFSLRDGIVGATTTGDWRLR